MNIEELIGESFQLLSNVLEEMHEYGTDGDPREAFIYRHTRNIWQLGGDVLLLEAHGNSDSCPIIARAMLEGLFKLVAAIKVEQAAVGIVLSEIAEEIEQINKWISVLGDSGGHLATTIKELSVVADDLRLKHNVTSSKNWNAFECAKTADLSDAYRQDYFILSKHTHVTASGIIAQENQVGKDRVLRVVVFVILCAVGHVVQVAQTKTPQQHVDDATRLMKEAIEYMETCHAY